MSKKTKIVIWSICLIVFSGLMLLFYFTHSKNGYGIVQFAASLGFSAIMAWLVYCGLVWLIDIIRKFWH